MSNNKKKLYHCSISLKWAGLCPGVMGAVAYLLLGLLRCRFTCSPSSLFSSSGPPSDNENDKRCRNREASARFRRNKKAETVH